MPDASHVGRRYTAPGQVVDPERAAAMAKAIAGPDSPFEPAAVPPTYAAVYCLAPAFAQLFTDQEVGINLAGLIHGEQAFEWPSRVQPGDTVDASAEILPEERCHRRGDGALAGVGRVHVAGQRPAGDGTGGQHGGVLA